MGGRRHSTGDSPAALASGELPFRIVENEEHYRVVIEEGMLRAEKYIKIATANVKDVHVKRRGRYFSILSEFERLVERGVSIRILHGGQPSGPFLDSLEERPGLCDSERFEMMYCPRSHIKMVSVDGEMLYIGSANFTGAGIGVKSPLRRNHEIGIVTENDALIRRFEEIFDTIWSTSLCESCGRRDVCF